MLKGAEPAQEVRVDSQWRARAALKPLMVLLLMIGLNVLNGFAISLVYYQYFGVLLELALLVWLIDSVVRLIYARLYVVNGIKINSVEDFEGLKDHEKAALQTCADNDAEQRKRVRVMLFIGALFATFVMVASIHGNARGLNLYAKAVLSLEADEAFSEPGAADVKPLNGDNYVNIDEDRLIRVLSQGAIAFGPDATDIVFVNDHGKIRAAFNVKYVQDAKDDIEKARKATSYCTHVRNKSLLRTLLPIEFPKDCPNLIDMHLKILNASAAREGEQ